MSDTDVMNERDDRAVWESTGARVDRADAVVARAEARSTATLAQQLERNPSAAEFLVRTLVTTISPALHPLTVDHRVNAPNIELTVAGEPMSPAEWFCAGGDEATVVELTREL